MAARGIVSRRLDWAWHRDIRLSGNGRVADSVVDDAIGNVFTELSTIFDGFIDGMVGNELQPLPELDVPPIT